MTSPLRKSLVDAIIASGCDDPEEAGKLAATPAAGSSVNFRYQDDKPEQ